jgi:hypothetical protein
MTPAYNPLHLSMSLPPVSLAYEEAAPYWEGVGPSSGACGTDHGCDDKSPFSRAAATLAHPERAELEIDGSHPSASNAPTRNRSRPCDSPSCDTFDEMRQQSCELLARDQPRSVSELLLRELDAHPSQRIFNGCVSEPGPCLRAAGLVSRVQ